MADPEIVALVSAINRLNETVEKQKSSTGNIGNSTINFDASSTAVWLSISCAAVLVVMNIMQSAVITKLENKYDRMQDYLNAIYAQAPHLKPKETSQ